MKTSLTTLWDEVGRDGGVMILHPHHPCHPMLIANREVRNTSEREPDVSRQVPPWADRSDQTVGHCGQVCYHCMVIPAVFCDPSLLVDATSAMHSMYHIHWKAH